MEVDLPLSRWHRSFLGDSAWGLASLTITPDKAIIAVRRPAREAYEPRGAIALDTNEMSLDGVAARGDASVLVRAGFPDVRVIQTTHFSRRRRLAKKKVHDRRVQRRLLAREGHRERNRIRLRLHLVSKGLVHVAKILRAAVVLEDVRMPQGGGRSRRMRRRLSSWPRGESPSPD